jgi:LacI family transcriptional regulator
MKKAIKDHKENLPSAFFVGNDSMAIGCLRALHEENIRVPEKVSLIGVNDISVSKYVFPPLSTVKVYTEFMGETAVDLLLERMTDRKIAKKVIISTQLEIRGSSQ